MTMPSSTPEAGFVSISNIVAEVLYAINDAEEKKFYPRVLQSVINSLRTSNVHYRRHYEEVVVTLDSDLMSGDYPSDLVKLISVGIYKNGEWWPFTRKPNMAKTVTGDGGTYDEDFGENEDIPRHGIMFGARGHNVGYWVEDDANCRFFVRNYEKTKVIARYRSNGIKCTTETCIPYILKDFIVSDVVYNFALSRVPTRFTGMELELKRRERERRYDEFTDIEYIPQDMNEFMDAQFASSNISPKRSL